MKQKLVLGKIRLKNHVRKLMWLIVNTAKGNLTLPESKSMKLFAFIGNPIRVIKKANSHWTSKMLKTQLRNNNKTKKIKIISIKSLENK